MRHQRDSLFRGHKMYLHLHVRRLGFVCHSYLPKHPPSALRADLGTEIPCPRIILNRRLKFKLHTPYRNPESAFVGVS